MQEKQTSHHWTAVIAAISVALVIVAFWRPVTWEYFGQFPYKPDFGDTVAVLAAGQAHQAGLDIYAPNPFDPHSRPHVYGPPWLVTGALGLTVDDSWWVGGLLDLIFILTAAVVLAPRGANKAVVALFLLCSPPVLLGLNRANNDLVVFILLAAGAAVLARKGAGAGTAGGAIIGLAAILKLYPIVAFPMALLRPGRWRSVLIPAAASAIACLLLVGFWAADFRRVFEIAPRPQSVLSYGLKLLELIYRLAPNYRTELILTCVIGVAVSGLVFVRGWRPLWNFVPVSGFSSLCFLAGGITWVFCFLSNTNFSYRFVLLLLPARLWLENAHDRKHGWVGRLQIVLWLVAAWISIPKCWWVRAYESTEWRELGFTWTVGLSGIEHGLMLVLTFALLFSCTGAVVRRIQAGFGEPSGAQPVETSQSAKPPC